MKKVIGIIVSVLLIVVVSIGVVKLTKVTNQSKPEQKTESKNLEDKPIVESREYEEENISKTKGGKFVKLGDIAVYLDDYHNNLHVFNLTTKQHKEIQSPENGLEKIYFDGEYIYGMPSYYRGKGIYKIDLEGNTKKIYEGASVQLWLTDDKIYFVDQMGYDQINNTPQGNLCTMQKDGSNKQIILNNVKNYFYLVDNYIYYIDQASRSIYRANIDGTEPTEMAKGRNYITAATNQYITYIDYADSERLRILYLDTLEDYALGRFGNVYDSVSGTYFYTRKVNSNDEVENDYTLFSVDLNNHSEVEHWTGSEGALDRLMYVYGDYCYFRGPNKYYRVNRNDKNDKQDMEFGASFFVNGKAYGTKSQEGKLTEFYWYNLEDGKKDEIIL